MYNSAMMSPKNKGSRKCLYMVMFHAKLFAGNGAGFYFFHLSRLSCSLWKMYRNDISTFHRKVFNILIFLSKQHVHPNSKAEEFLCCFNCSPSRRFVNFFLSIYLCVMFTSYVSYPAAQFNQIAQLLLSLF